MRVLNLWQKNEVFSTTLIQKLMALAPNPGEMRQKETYYCCIIVVVFVMAQVSWKITNSSFKDG